MKKLHFFKPKLVKPKFFLGVPLALFSLEVYFGAIFGYLFAKFLSGKQVGDPAKIKSLAFNISNYRFHFHHWFYGLGILVFVLLLGLSFPFPQFSFGFLGGFIFQGISSYPDWHKILIKKN